MRFVEVCNYAEDMEVRFEYLRFEEGTGQEKSHTYSYIHCREMYKELGEVMGLDQTVQEFDEW